MSRFLVMADGPDEPGIVASVTSGLASLGCNLEDTSMTRLAGRFVMLLIVSAPEEVSGEGLLQSISEATEDHSLNVGVEWLADEAEANEVVDGERWSVSVYGSDHPGIVAAVAEVLADAGVNIDDLTTRVIGEPDSLTYTMLIDATVPDFVDSAALISSLTSLGDRLGVSCHARPVDSDSDTF